MEKVYSEDEEFIVTEKGNIGISEIEQEVVALFRDRGMTLEMVKYVFSKILEKEESKHFM